MKFNINKPSFFVAPLLVTMSSALFITSCTSDTDEKIDHIKDKIELVILSDLKKENALHVKKGAEVTLDASSMHCFDHSDPS